jgi:putative peptide zinc metalloprotease protein
MNLSEALNAALPEIPKTRFARSRPPRLDPNLIVREDTLGGEPFIGVLQRDKANFYRFTPADWRLAQLFDGVCTYEEIAGLYLNQGGALLTAEDVRIFAESLDGTDLWYKTPQEKNLALSQKLMSQRARRAQRSSRINLAHISFSAWDPDVYLTWLDRRVGNFVYSNWCVLAVVLLFCFEALVYVVNWKVIGPDVVLFYNFTRKSAYDLAEFYLLFLVIGFIHETAHGLTCKHYGGEVHSMGLMFLYLTPAFYVDVTETFVTGTKTQRLATIIAGIWIEMVLCGLAMIVWTNTQPGQWLHDFSYEIILLTGLAVILINLNPLIKLDGYYFLSDWIDVPDLKEQSTAFVSGWFQRHVLRLPVAVPIVPRRRVLTFAVYAITSGAYSYLLLFAVVRFSYNIASHWLAEFALIPAGALAFAIFRGRLRALKEQAARVWGNAAGSRVRWRPGYLLGVAALLSLLFVPFWRDREGAYFLIEPQRSTTLYAGIAGKIDAVLVRDGETVRAGQPLLHMTSVDAASMRSVADAQTRSARFQGFEAELQGGSIGVAGAELEAANQSTALAGEAQSSLAIAAPIDGTVVTSNPDALLHRDVASGQPLLSLADAGPRSVRIFVSAPALDRIPSGAEVAIVPPGCFSVIRMTLGPLGGGEVSLPDGFIARQDYKGIHLPVFYTTRIPLPAVNCKLALGMSGTANIFGARRSIADRLFTVAVNLFRAHVW